MKEIEIRMKVPVMEEDGELFLELPTFSEGQELEVSINEIENNEE